MGASSARTVLTVFMETVEKQVSGMCALYYATNTCALACTTHTDIQPIVFFHFTPRLDGGEGEGKEEPG